MYLYTRCDIELKTCECINTSIYEVRYWTQDVRMYRYIDIRGAILKSRRASVSIHRCMRCDIELRTCECIDTSIYEVRYWTQDVRVYRYIDIRGAILNSRRANVSIHGYTRCDIELKTCECIDASKYEVRYWTQDVRVYRYIDIRDAILNSKCTNILITRGELLNSRRASVSNYRYTRCDIEIKTCECIDASIYEVRYWTQDVRVYRSIDIRCAILNSRRASISKYRYTRCDIELKTCECIEVSIYEVRYWILIVQVYRLREVRCWTQEVRVYRCIDIRVECWTLNYGLHMVRYGTPDVRVYRCIEMWGAILNSKCTSL